MNLVPIDYLLPSIDATSSGFVTGYGENKSREYVARAWLLYDDIAISRLYSIENVSYFRGFSNVSGCTWTIEYMDSEVTTNTVIVTIPKDYSGARSCNYNSIDYSAPADEDALNDAIYRLFDKIDSSNPNDGILDKINGRYYDSPVMEFKVANITSPFLTNTTEVNLILWLR